MEYQNFKKIIELLKKSEKRSNDLYKLGLTVYDLFEEMNNSIDLLFEEIYGKEGLDWISWFRFETDYGRKDFSKQPLYESVEGKLKLVEKKNRDKYGAHDEKGNPICYSIKSTWEYLEKNHKK